MENMNTIVGTFKIPEEVAKKLSTLLTQQSIREKMLSQVINDPVRYEMVENMLIPLVDEISTLKTLITNDYVPDEFRSAEYVWNYDGYAIKHCDVDIMKS